MAVDLEADVDAVARGAGDGARDHPLLVSQGVGEGALPHVAATDDRQLHLRKRRPLGLLGPSLGEMRDDLVDEFGPVAVLPNAHDQRLAEAELVEIMGEEVVLRVVGLVGNQQDRRPGQSHPAGHFAVGRQEAAADLDDEHDQGGGGEPRGDLGVDLGGEAVGIVESHPAGVDEIEDPVLEAHPLDETIAGDAGRRILDGDPLLDEPVEEGRFADIGSANNRDLGDELESQRCISGVWGVDRSRPIGGRDHHARPTQLTSPTEIWWLAPF